MCLGFLFAILRKKLIGSITITYFFVLFAENGLYFFCRNDAMRDCVDG